VTPGKQADGSFYGEYSANKIQCPRCGYDNLWAPKILAAGGFECPRCECWVTAVRLEELGK
jgi:hypothetical protein